jgi:hypothetical protein
MKKRSLASLALAAGLAMTVIPAAPVLADGAASTRNILIGGAAAALLIINHNKKVHEKYDEDARRQAAAEASANNAQAAYATEKRLYENQVALNQQYKREAAIQHNEIVKLRNQVAYEKQHAFAQPAQVTVPQAQTQGRPLPVRVAVMSYGWGAL